MSSETEKFTVINKRGRKISAVFHLPEHDRKGNHCVVLCHGMLSSKEGTKQIALARTLQENNMACVRFDFSGCGDSDGKIEDTTVSKRIDDLEAVVEKVTTMGYSSISLVGSSLGAAVAILAAGGNLVSTLTSLVVFASVSRPGNILRKVPEDVVRGWMESGFFDMDGTKIRWSFIEDAQRHDIIGAAQNIKCPALLIHGSKDELIPAASSREIVDVIDSDKKLVILDNADHSFSEGRHLRQLIDLTVSWIKKWAA